MREILIHDIYALEPVHDSSLYLFTALLLSIVIIVFFFIRWMIKNHHKHQNRTLKYGVEILKQCDFSQVKNTAYKITYYGKMMAQTDKERALYYALVESLKEYKYNKSLTELPSTVKEALDELITEVESHHVG